MEIVLFDTNILIDNLEGHAAAVERAATLRGHSITHPPKYSLPDCIVRATAEAEGRLIITRNPADFGGEGPRVRVPYDIVAGVAVNIKAPPA